MALVANGHCGDCSKYVDEENNFNNFNMFIFFCCSKLVSILVSGLSLLCTFNLYFYNEVLKSGDQKYSVEKYSQIRKILRNQV